MFFYLQTDAATIIVEKGNYEVYPCATFVQQYK